MELLKKYAKTGIAIICAIFTAFMGFFAVANTGVISVNGFYLLNFNNALFIITGIVAILGVLGGVASLIVVTYSILKKPLKLDLIPIVSVAITVVYMILGIVVAEGLPTLCFIPFILEVVFAICYFISDKVFKK